MSENTDVNTTTEAQTVPQGDLRFGLDVGSTTVKLVAANAKTGEMYFSRYRRHQAHLAETAVDLIHEAIEELGPDAGADPDGAAPLPMAVCGSGGRPLANALGVPYIQEVVANAEAVMRLYPQTSCAIELGGQDAKVLFFEKDEATGQVRASDMRMNGSCAGGTGAFIDEIAKLMNVEPEGFDALAAAGTRTYDISGRCGVFAKTDIQPLLSQGAEREDLCLSTFHAIAKQVIGGLAQGLEITPPILFEGGPLTYNPTLVRVFSERLNLSEDEAIVPEHPETIVARGAALAYDRLSERLAAGSENLKETATEKVEPVRNLAEAAERLDRLAHTPTKASNSFEKPFFTSEEDREAFMSRHNSELRETEQSTCAPAPGTPENPATLPVYLGIDSGSTTSKFVLLDDDGRVIHRYYAHNNGDPLAVLRTGLLEAEAEWLERGYALDVRAMASTGYGENMVARAFGADVHTVETIAHAKGCTAYVPDASFVLDIGGQDMKAIWLKDGIVTDIMLNEACSSGCGSFLENFATTLNVTAEEIADAAFRSEHPAKLGSRCTVFMTSTVVNAQREGKSSDDILAGLCRSIVENVFTKVVRVSNFDMLGDRIVVQGGTFKNMAVLRSLEEYLGREVTLAPYPGEMGAVGAGLLAREHAQSVPDQPSEFLGFDGLRNFSKTTKDGVHCKGCQNECALTITRFNNGKTWVTGNRCERGAAQGKSATQEAPDVFAMRADLLMKEYDCTPAAPDQGVRIGIPRVLEFWNSMPFWTTFFRVLGFTPVISHPSSHELYEQALRHVADDTVCLPAKMAHGHIQDLAQQGVDRIFFPHVMHMPPEGTDKKSPYACAIIMGYPTVVENFQSPEELYGIPYDDPVFHWYSEKDRHNQVTAWARETLGATEEAAESAFTQAMAAQKSFHTELESYATAVIRETEERGGFCVVLAGRPYHSDPYLSHDISRHFATRGVPVIPVDALPGLNEVDLSHTRVEVTNNFHTRMLAGAKIAAASPTLEYVQIVSFGCGHDAVLTDEITRILQEVGDKHPLILKVDESEASGSLGIRIQSFIETVKARREAAPEGGNPDLPRELPDAYPAKFVKGDKKKRTVIVPNISHEVSLLFEALLKREGYTPQLVPVGTVEQIKLGKRYTHNDICFPCQMVIGEAIDALREGGWEDRQDEVAVGMVKFQCDCRLSHYGALLRKALDAAGFEDVPVITTDAGDSKNMHPGTMLLEPRVIVSALWGFMMLDILTDLKHKIRPYELVEGSTNKLYEDSVQAIANGLEHNLNAGIQAYKQAIDDFAELPYDRSHPKPRVLVTGELLVTYHPGSNFHIEDYLESCGMETIFPRVTSQLRKDFAASASQYSDFNASTDPSGILVGKLFDMAQSTMERLARKHPLFEPEPTPSEEYEGVKDFVPKTLSSGEGWLMAAEIAHYAEEGVRSFVILQPFGCVPNHVCGRGMTKALKERYPQIQILPLDLDPDTSFANIENRLQMLVMNDGSSEAAQAAAEAEAEAEAEEEEEAETKSGKKGKKRSKVA